MFQPTVHRDACEILLGVQLLQHAARHHPKLCISCDICHTLQIHVLPNTATPSMHVEKSVQGNRQSVIHRRTSQGAGGLQPPRLGKSHYFSGKS